jgi:hypothetical protein
VDAFGWMDVMCGMRGRCDEGNDGTRVVVLRCSATPSRQCPPYSNLPLFGGRASQGEARSPSGNLLPLLPHLPLLNCPLWAICLMRSCISGIHSATLLTTHSKIALVASQLCESLNATCPETGSNSPLFAPVATWNVQRAARRAPPTRTTLCRVTSFTLLALIRQPHLEHQNNNNSRSHDLIQTHRLAQYVDASTRVQQT